MTSREGWWHQLAHRSVKSEVAVTSSSSDTSAHAGCIGCGLVADPTILCACGNLRLQPLRAAAHAAKLSAQLNTWHSAGRCRTKLAALSATMPPAISAQPQVRTSASEVGARSPAGSSFADTTLLPGCRDRGDQ